MGKSINEKMEYIYPPYRDKTIPVVKDRIRVSRKNLVFITPEIHALLKEYANSHNSTMTDIVNKVLIAFLTSSNKKGL
jgi:hypothetical protein